MVKWHPTFGESPKRPGFSHGFSISIIHRPVRLRSFQTNCLTAPGFQHGEGAHLFQLIYKSMGVCWFPIGGVVGDIYITAPESNIKVVYTANWVIIYHHISPIPPIKGTRNHHWQHLQMLKWYIFDCYVCLPMAATSSLLPSKELVFSNLPNATTKNMQEIPPPKKSAPGKTHWVLPRGSK